MRRTIAIALAGLSALAVAASSAEPPSGIAWDRIIGANPGALDAKQKERVASLLGSVRNTRGCQGTIAACLAAGDQTARRHAGYVARMARKSKDDAFIRQGIADRAASAFPAQVHGIDVADRPVRGAAGAPVTLVEFACFQCPYCAHLAPQLEGIGKRFPGKVAYYYKYFPVRSHPRGVQSALAGLAAQRQDRFWQMAELMFENRADLEDADLAGYASQAGLDMAKYRADIADPAAMKVIEKDKLEGMRVGVDGTPTFFVNGKLFRGQADFEELADRIGEELDIVEGRIR